MTTQLASNEMEFSDDKREEVETVNDSVETTASMEYISRRKKYAIFRKYPTRRTVSAAAALLDKDPEYLVKQETSFLSEFVSVFGRAETQSGYNVEPDDFMGLITSGIAATRARLTEERSAIINELDTDEVIGEGESPKSQKLQYLFVQIHNMLKDLHEDIMENYDRYSENPLEFSEKKEKITALSEFLVRAYVIEYEMFEGNDAEISGRDILDLTSEVASEIRVPGE